MNRECLRTVSLLVLHLVLLCACTSRHAVRCDRHMVPINPVHQTPTLEAAP